MEARSSSFRLIFIAVLVSTAISSILTAVVIRSLRTAPLIYSSPTTVSPTTAVVSSEDELIRDAVSRVAPSVVSITTAVASSTFGGGGSGFLVRQDGYIITNRHVVGGDGVTYTVTMSNGKEYLATLIGVDQVLDLALLKIPEEKLPVVILGDSGMLFVGQTVLAIGNSLAEFQNSVTKGIISGLGRQVIAGDFLGDAEVIEGAIQTDAAINPGSSGGPLINVRGEVIGVNTAVSRRGQLVGFALPINSVKQLIASAVEFGRIVHPWLGVRYRIINAGVQQELKLPVASGALIVKGMRQQEKAIAPGSPAAKSRLREGDIIVRINATDITEVMSLSHEVAKYRVGDTIILRIIRDGATQDVPVTLEEFPQNP